MLEISFGFGEIGPFNLEWHVQAPSDVAFEQKLLIEGTLAGDSLEVYTIRLNEIPFSYTTQIQNEPKESVKNELINIIDQSPQFNASENPSNPFEILLTTESLASLELGILSKTSSVADKIETLGLSIPILFANSTEFFKICILVSNFGKTFKAPSVIIKGLSFFSNVICHT